MLTQWCRTALGWPEAIGLGRMDQMDVNQPSRQCDSAARKITLQVWTPRVYFHMRIASMLLIYFQGLWNLIVSVATTAGK